MAITNGYASLAEVKAALRITDSIDDSLLEMAVESASRLIDGFAARQFYSQGTATRYFVAQDDFVVEVDDLGFEHHTIVSDLLQFAPAALLARPIEGQADPSLVVFGLHDIHQNRRTHDDV